MIVIEINKYPDGHYHVDMSKSINNSPSTKFEGIHSTKNFETAISEARKLARSYSKEGHLVMLGVHGGSKLQNGKFLFGNDKKFHKTN